MSKLRYLFDRLLLIPALILVIGPVQTAAAAVAGDFYVSGVGDDVSGDGSEANPWRTISHAVAQAGGGHPTIMVGPGHGDFAHFQPGAGTSMGFDDLKTIEAALFLRSVIENRQLAPSAADAWSAAEIVDAAVSSAASGTWVAVATVTGSTTYDA